MQKIEETFTKARECFASCAGEAEKIKKSLPVGHVIHTMVCEHDVILKFLDELENLNIKMQSGENYPENKEEISRLRHIAEHLVEAEPHHSREENVLFPDSLSYGIAGYH